MILDNSGVFVNRIEREDCHTGKTSCQFWYQDRHCYSSRHFNWERISRRQYNFKNKYRLSRMSDKCSQSRRNRGGWQNK